MWLLFVKKSAMALNGNLVFLEKKQKKFSSNSTDITEKCTISTFNYDMLEAVLANLQVQDTI